WQLMLAQGVVIGVAGSVASAPIIADTSLWFSRRRGIAVSIIASGSYLAGTVWPPVVHHFISIAGWRRTYLGIGVFCVAAMLPLALGLRRRSPRTERASAVPRREARTRPLGMSPGALQVVLVIAALSCCVAMAMPQVHIVAYSADLGHGAANGAQMLSLMLGAGVVSRLVSGWICDRIGGRRTLLLSSGLQMLALALFLPFDGLVSLYILSALFGLVQGGIVPAYAVIIREFFPADEAGVRVGIVLMATVFGMALGGSMTGAIYDLTGSYRAAFLNGLGWNLLNFGIALALLRRPSRPSRLIEGAPSSSPSPSQREREFLDILGGSCRPRSDQCPPRRSRSMVRVCGRPSWPRPASARAGSIQVCDAWLSPTPTVRCEIS